MRRIWPAYFVGIILAAGYGTYLAAGYGREDRGQWWIRSHVDIIGDQLDGLKKQLRKYKDTHGRYPTNDEGLAVLDNFDARFTVNFYRDPDEPPGPLGSLHGGPFGWSWWGSSRRVISDFRKEKGLVPWDENEFGRTSLGLSLRILEEERSEVVRVELAIGEGDNIFLPSPAGVLSPWFIPYVYENRNGLDQSKFEGSPADSEEDPRYWVTVDDGVYVSSVGGRFYVKQLNRGWWQYNWPRFAGGGLLLAATVLLVLMFRTSWKAGVLGIVAMLASAGAGFQGAQSYVATCYVMSPLFSRRDREMVAQRMDLLDKYHSNGVIGDKAYERALSVLERGPAAQAISAPEQDTGE